MPYRKAVLVKDGVYHIYTRSIAGYRIFNRGDEYDRMIGTIAFYALEDTPCSFSVFDKLNENIKKSYILPIGNIKKIVRILAYCLMPTHIHFILQETKEGGISKFANLVLKSYSKYFNIKHGRKGPLWEGRFNSVSVETDEQLLHLTRYVHLNPVTANIVEDPENWPYSSFKEYLSIGGAGKVCDYDNILDIKPTEYKIFVNDGISYQRELARFKHLWLE